MRLQEGTGYYANRHSCFLLQYHLVVVTKYRHPVLVGEVSERLKELTHELLEGKWGCNVIAVETDEDHVHVLFEAPPQVAPASLVNNYKTVTSRYLRKEFAEELKDYYWKPVFWSQSYFICSVSEKSAEVVERYIENQGCR